MVAGAVSPPRLDLSNEDLVRAHVHAVWLAESGLHLGKSMTEVIDAYGDDPSLILQQNIRDGLNEPGPYKQALKQAFFLCYEYW